MNKYELALVVNAKVEEDVKTATVEKAKEYKHMTFYEAAELAAKAGVKELWLTHYSPSLTDPREFMGRVREIFPGSRAGKDGKTVVLNYEEKEDD